MQGFEATWAEACKVESSTMLIPADYVFLVGPIVFSGQYCKPKIIFQVTFFIWKSYIFILFLHLHVKTHALVLHVILFL